VNLDYVPLLQIQRDLHLIPRGMERFERYLGKLPDRDGSDVVVPLLVVNPMAKDHVLHLLDALIAFDADAIGARAAADAAATLGDVPGRFKTAVVVADDLMGAGTNRHACEYDLRFGPVGARPSSRTRNWLTGVLWSSEAPTERAVREAVLTAAHRVAYGHAHAPGRTLRDKLAQEGYVMARAGCAGPCLDPGEIEYTREVIAPHLDSEDMPTAIGCLFGDAASRALGFAPRGLSAWAGLALALHDARSAPPPGAIAT
jgi:hypothetical protein